MVVHQTALWVLLIVCSVAGAAYELASASREARADRPHLPLGRYVSSTLTGVGIGMAVASLVLIAVALIVRLE
jgi:hypothetical protein